MMKCDECGYNKVTVKHRDSMTAYYWDGKGDDPNDPGNLCDICYEEYRAYWTEKWDEYRSSQGF